MAGPSRTESVSPAALTAALPVLALLGATLPLAYLPQIGDYLYYLRPAELVPTYGTAWLCLALAALPFWLLLTLLLRALAAGSSGSVRVVHAAAARLMSALAAVLIACALVYCLLVWLHSFGTLRALSLQGPVLWVVLLAAAAWGIGLRGHRRLRQALPLLGVCTALGFLTTLTLPLYRWRSPPALTPVALGHASAERRPNIVLLSFDAMSAEHMSLYGAARATTPALTQFAREATTFEQMYANGNYTTPGVSSLLTGTRPWTHRAFQLQAWPIDSTRRDSLPALLQRSGYQTGYVSTNSAAGAAKNGMAGYFDFSSHDRIKDVDLCTDGLSALLRYVCPVAAMPLFANLVTTADRLRGGRDLSHYDPQLALDPALAWLRRVDPNRPVFLWVHLFPPHSPYAVPEPWLGHFDPSPRARTFAETEPHWAWSMRDVPPADVQLLAARYDESMRYADHYAGLFLHSALQLLGPRTAVLITSDHGESFRHGYGAHTGPGLYNELIRVPLVIRLPGQTRALRSSAVVEQIDLAPTLAQLAGIPIPASWEGHSLLGAWTAGGQLPSAPAFSMNFEQTPRFGVLRTGSAAVIDGHWKLIHYVGHLQYPQMPPLHDTLYDLADDPLENTDLAASHPDEVARLRALIDAELARHSSPFIAP